MQGFRQAGLTATALLAMALLSACSTPTTRTAKADATAIDAEAKYQQELAQRSLVENQLRLFRISSRLLAGAAPLCKDNVVAYTGLVLPRADADKSKTGTATISKEDNNASTGMMLGFLVDGSPARVAGLQAGDVLIAIDGTPITSDAQVQKIFQDRKLIAKPLRWAYRRGAQIRSTNVSAIASCNFPGQISSAMDLNAYADGSRVIITQGMMNFAGSEEELALVVSHEIAHNLMRHLDAKKTNAVGGMLADVLLAVASRGTYIGSSMSQMAGGAYSQEFESEADYVGLYIMARSGYRIDDAPKFWRRMAVASPGNIKSGHTASHPSTANRMVALDNAVAEIKAKQAAGQPLEPNMK